MAVLGPAHEGLNAANAAEVRAQEDAPLHHPAEPWWRSKAFTLLQQGSKETTRASTARKALLCHALPLHRARPSLQDVAEVVHGPVVELVQRGGAVFAGLQGPGGVGGHQPPHVTMLGWLDPVATQATHTKTHKHKQRHTTNTKKQ
eukprot:15439948-Alexandrium_andersonii.AAC.1